MRVAGGDVADDEDDEDDEGDEVEVTVTGTRLEAERLDEVATGVEGDEEDAEEATNTRGPPAATATPDASTTTLFSTSVTENEISLRSSDTISPAVPSILRLISYSFYKC